MNAHPQESQRILLVRLSAIGDVIHALHGLAALRAVRPEARIGFLVEDRAAALLEDHPDIDEVHVFPRKAWSRGLFRRPDRVATEVAGFTKALRRPRYQVTVDLQGNLKSGVLASLSGAPRRIGLAAGFGKEGNHRFQNVRVALPAGKVHRVDRVFHLLSPLGVTGPAGTPRIPVRPEDREDIDRFLRDGGFEEGAFAMIHPGTSAFGLHKRWPASSFGDLAKSLRDRTGMRSVVTWGPGERDLAEEVVTRAAGAAVAGPATRRLTALAHLAVRSGLVVAADTGALHLAALLGTPTLGLFGPKDPGVYAPRGARTAVVYEGVDCSPCPRRACPDPVCMTSMQPETVLDAALRLLEES